MKRKSSLGSIVLVVVLAAAWYAKEQWLPASEKPETTTSTSSSRPGTPPTRGGTATRPRPTTDDAALIARAFAQKKSDLIVTVPGTVIRTLADDNDPPRHQRFIIKLSNDRTVLIAHNTDLAKRVPLKKGDRVQIHGEYEWNARGGVLHWTHHDPRGRHEGGWIKHAGKTYE